MAGGAMDSRGRREGAADEVAPREVEAGTGVSGAVPVGGPGAVDENRPADLLAQGTPADMPGGAVGTNVLQRGHAIVPEDRRHVQTPGQELIEEDGEVDLPAGRAQV
jgi:hypothetical protein